MRHDGCCKACDRVNGVLLVLDAVQHGSVGFSSAVFDRARLVIFVLPQNQQWLPRLNNCRLRWPAAAQRCVGQHLREEVGWIVLRLPNTLSDHRWTEMRIHPILFWRWGTDRFFPKPSNMWDSSLRILVFTCRSHRHWVATFENRSQPTHANEATLPTQYVRL